MAIENKKVGILGIGHLAGFIIEGAIKANPNISFVLSPRSLARATNLATRYNATVAPDNQSLVDQCDMILVCLPVAQGAEILSGLIFRPEQSVLSAMAGVSRDVIAKTVAPASSFLTMMPGHANALGHGPCLLYPTDPQWDEFLSLIGQVFPIETADIFEVASVFGGFSGANFAFITQISEWFESKGLPADLARHLVAETLRGNAHVVASVDTPLREISKGVATSGGITEKCVDTLNSQGALIAWSDALDAVFKKVSGS